MVASVEFHRSWEKSSAKLQTGLKVLLLPAGCESGANIVAQCCVIQEQKIKCHKASKSQAGPLAMRPSIKTITQPRRRTRYQDAGGRLRGRFLPFSAIVSETSYDHAFRSHAWPHGGPRQTSWGTHYGGRLTRLHYSRSSPA